MVAALFFEPLSDGGLHNLQNGLVTHHVIGVSSIPQQDNLDEVLYHCSCIYLYLEQVLQGTRCVTLSSKRTHYYFTTPPTSKHKHKRKSNHKLTDHISHSIVQTHNTINSKESHDEFPSTSNNIICGHNSNARIRSSVFSWRTTQSYKRDSVAAAPSKFKNNN